MEGHDPHLEERLQAYIDGQLKDDERADFERELVRRPVLRQALEDERAIAGALRRLWPVPDAQEIGRFARVAVDGSPRADRRRPSWLGVLAVAASLVLVVSGSWMTWRVVSPDARVDPYAPQPWRSMATVYRETVERGFTPAWVCANDREFHDAFRRQFGQRLHVDPLPADVVTLGLSYSNTISTWTICLLARADGEPLIVFVDQLENDGRFPAPDGFHLHRAEIGMLVAYELSPLDTARVLPYLVDPAAAPDAGGDPGSEEVQR